MTEFIIYLHSRSPQSARKWSRELKILQKSLEVLPSRFPRHPHSGIISYRAAIHYLHKVIFRIDEKAKAVTIVRIYHSARKPVEFDSEVE
jgi:plasmid stabilization system protein ParE